jgi:hypothetical protein
MKFLAKIFRMAGSGLFVLGGISLFLGGLTNPYGGMTRMGQPLNPDAYYEVGPLLYSVLGFLHWSVLLAALLALLGWGMKSLGSLAEAATKENRASNRGKNDLKNKVNPDFRSM